MENIFDLNEEQQQRALDIHRQAYNIDGMYTYTFETELVVGPLGASIGSAGKSKVLENNERRKQGGITASISHVVFFPTSFRKGVENILAHYRLIEAADGFLQLVTTAADIEKVKAENKVGIILGWQDPCAIENNVELLEVFYRLGLRTAGLVYNDRNSIGDGCIEETDAGLSKFGRACVEKCNELGIVIDGNHAGVRTTMEIMELSKDPVIFSHIGARGVLDQPGIPFAGRNMTDEQIKACAETGGVIGISSWSTNLKIPPEYPTIHDYLDHMDYIADLVGVDHVGLGLDMAENISPAPLETEFARVPGYKESLENAGVAIGWLKELYYIEQRPNVTMGLVARGYSDKDILKILGGNFLRVFREVWK